MKKVHFKLHIINILYKQKRITGNIYHLKIQARFSSPDMESDGDETAMVSCNFETQLTSQAKTIQLLDP